MPPIIVRRPSGSKLARAFACPASCWLPEAPEGPAHPAAARGTRLHHALERSFLTAREPDIYHGLRPEEVPLARKAIAGRPYLAPVHLHWPLVEVECWYSPLSLEAKFGSFNGDENDEEAVPPGWWRMRADAIGRTQTETLKPWDWKTGSPKHQTPPNKSAQLYFAAAYLASHPDTAPEVNAVGGVDLGIYTTQNGQLLGHHLPLVATAQQKEMAEKRADIAPDIETFQASMAALEGLLSIVEAGGPEGEAAMAANPPVKNKECFFCPAKPNCPVWQK